MRDLLADFEALNDEQRAAVRSPGNTVVLAGPGSGKTATLVIKVAHLLSDEIRPPRGVACITYNRDTVREFRKRLGELGIHSGPTLFLGTVHSFCLNCVLRPFAAIAGNAALGKRTVVTDRVTEVVLQRCLDAEGVSEKAQWFTSRLTKIRRRLACREGTDDFGAEEVRVARGYEKSLLDEGHIDFEGMVLEALHLIEGSTLVRDILVARFPWLVVDEYQDLGGPLHRIVRALADQAHVKVFAVGDRDQTIYDFTGADPKYLDELARDPAFTCIRLRLNYRSGSRLIDLSQTALAMKRDYHADPKRKDPGEVYVRNLNGGLEGQVHDIVNRLVPWLGKNGVALDEVAILYPRKGTFLTRLVEELTKANVPFTAERDERLPGAPVIKWLQQCATWALSTDEGILFESLLREYHELLQDAGLADQTPPSLEIRRRLFGVLEQTRQGTVALHAWLSHIEGTLDIGSALRATETRIDDLADYQSLLQRTAADGNLKHLQLADFANSGRSRGRLVVTTLHSSKGRQFDVVIMPTLQEVILPRRAWNRGRRQYDEPTARGLAEERRLFYVGFTRARRFVFLLYSDRFQNDYGYDLPGPSRFVAEIQARLAGE